MNNNTTLNTEPDFIPNLTYDERKEIVEEILQEPVETVTIAASPEDEASENMTTYYFGVVNLAGKWCVYSCQEDDCGLEFGGSFTSRDEALDRASVWGYETERAVENDLDDQKNAVWTKDGEASPDLVAPFRFSDTTDFMQAVGLEDEVEVFDFFKSREFLFSPKEWGNLYSPLLVDANGRACWVARSPRGEMRLFEN